MSYRLGSVVAIFLLCLKAGVSADGLQFSATLDSFRLHARPGQVLHQSFRLTLAPEEKRTYFRSRLQDWWSSEDGSQSHYEEPGTLARSCGNWVALDPVETAIDGGQTLEVRLSISVPATIEPGGYWCVLTVDQLPDPLEKPSGVQLRFLASISVGIFIYVEPVQRSARITSVRAEEDRVYVTVVNEGNSPTGVDGRLEFLRPGEDRPVATAIIGRRTALTEPVRTTILKAALPGSDELPDGTYLVRAVLDIGLDHYIGAQKRMEIRR